jgi:hypothetical protein
MSKKIIISVEHRTLQNIKNFAVTPLFAIFVRFLNRTKISETLHEE